jgi:hypothetical protein
MEARHYEDVSLLPHSSILLMKFGNRVKLMKIS